MSSGKAWASGVILLKEVWMKFMVSKGGFFGWFGWDVVVIVLVIGGWVCSDGWTMLIIVGWSDEVSTSWFSICERSVYGIHGDSVIVVSDGLNI